MRHLHSDFICNVFFHSTWNSWWSYFIYFTRYIDLLAYLFVVQTALSGNFQTYRRMYVYSLLSRCYKTQVSGENLIFQGRYFCQSSLIVCWQRGSYPMMHWHSRGSLGPHLLGQGGNPFPRKDHPGRRLPCPFLTSPFKGEEQENKMTFLSKQ